MRLLAASAGQQVELLQVKAKSDLVLSLARAERGRSRGFPRLVDQLQVPAAGADFKDSGSLQTRPRAPSAQLLVLAPAHRKEFKRRLFRLVSVSAGFFLHSWSGGPAIGLRLCARLTDVCLLFRTMSGPNAAFAAEGIANVANPVCTPALGDMYPEGCADEGTASLRAALAQVARFEAIWHAAQVQAVLDLARMLAGTDSASSAALHVVSDRSVSSALRE